MSPREILVVGSVGLDSVRTPYGEVGPAQGDDAAGDQGRVDATVG